MFWGLLTFFITHFRLSIGIVSSLNLLEILALSQNLLNKKIAIQTSSIQLILTIAMLNCLIGFAFFISAKLKRSCYERKFTEYLLRRHANQVTKEELLQSFHQYIDESNQIINQLICSLEQFQKSPK
ncbi:MAG: hypothetical protein ACRDEA_11875 [Microcystaceae cyanobacterium]